MLPQHLTHNSKSAGLGGSGLGVPGTVNDGANWPDNLRLILTNKCCPQQSSTLLSSPLELNDTAVRKLKYQLIKAYLVMLMWRERQRKDVKIGN